MDSPRSQPKTLRRAESIVSDSIHRPDAIHCPGCRGPGIEQIVFEHPECGSIGHFATLFGGEDLDCPKCSVRLDADVDLLRLGTLSTCGACGRRFDGSVAATALPGREAGGE